MKPTFEAKFSLYLDESDIVQDEDQPCPAKRMPCSRWMKSVRQVLYADIWQEVG